MLLPIQQIAAIAGTNRETVGKRAAQLNLQPIDGEKGAKLYDTRALLRLIPPPSRSEGAVTLEEARIRSENAKARLSELQIAEKEGLLADVAELLSRQNILFDELSSIVKKSTMTEAEKEDALSILSSAPRACWGDF